MGDISRLNAKCKAHIFEALGYGLASQDHGRKPGFATLGYAASDESMASSAWLSMFRGSNEVPPVVASRKVELYRYII
jgi:hypothetical protein